jgi:drug/metabolite transporter (DMT)-like permease
MGLQRETASRGTLANYTSVCLLPHSPLDVSQLFQIIFAVGFEFIIFHTTPSALSIAGIVIIMSSAIYISVVSLHRSHPLFLLMPLS